MSDWRKNPNLAECFENCVTMFRWLPEQRRNQRDQWIVEVKQRREALGMTRIELSAAAGRTRTYVASFERGCCGSENTYRHIADTLARLEAERG